MTKNMKNVIKIIPPALLKKFSSNHNEVTDTYFNFPKLIRNFYWKRLNTMLKLSLKYKNKDIIENVLGLGCGQGVLLPSLSYYYKNVTGIDLNIFSAARIVKHFKLFNVNLFKCSFLSNNFTKNSFDIIFAASVLEHFDDIEKIIIEIKRLLRENGLLIFSSPTETKLYEFARRCFKVKKPDDHYHSAFDIINVTKKHLELIKLKKLPYNFFPIELSLHVISVFKKAN